MNMEKKPNSPTIQKFYLYVFFSMYCFLFSCCFFLAEAKAKDMQLNISMAMLINADFTANLGVPKRRRDFNPLEGFDRDEWLPTVPIWGEKMDLAPRWL